MGGFRRLMLRKGKEQVRAWVCGWFWDRSRCRRFILFRCVYLSEGRCVLCCMVGKLLGYDGGMESHGNDVCGGLSCLLVASHSHSVVGSGCYLREGILCNLHSKCISRAFFDV